MLEPQSPLRTQSFLKILATFAHFAVKNNLLPEPARQCSRCAGFAVDQLRFHRMSSKFAIIKVMSKLNIPLPKEKLANYCRRYHIRRLAFFGSVLRDDFTPSSDVDVLVEFEPGYTPGLAFFGMQEELAKILGRKVDLNTPNFLSPYFRKQVQQDAIDYVTA
jgi:predicted nucleotidyltransferase